MRATFPYLQRGDTYYPVADVVLRHGKKDIAVKALVDSGASFSVFRTEIAEFLGITVDHGKEVYLAGVGGRIRGYIHTLRVRVGAKTFQCPVIFSDEFHVSLNLIGRKGFFSRFVVTFDDKSKRLTLIS